MTVGSKTIDQRTSLVYKIDGAPQLSRLVGRYRSKSWNGGDSISRTLKGGLKKRFYTLPVTVSRRGKTTTRLVTHSFYEKPPRKRGSRLSPNAYTVNWVDQDLTPTAYNIDVRRASDGALLNRTRYSDLSWAPLPNPVTFSANDQLTLIGKLREKIRGSDFNMAIFLGEGHESLKMIGVSAITIAKALNATRKGNVFEAARILYDGKGNAVQYKRPRELKTLSANWLQLQWGWIPLLSDMKAGAEQLAHRLEVPFKQRYSAIFRVDGPVVISGNSKPSAAECYSVASRRIVATISEQESLPVLSGLMDPELVAWELLPFSWLVDYVSPIGDYLAARAFASRLNGVFVTSTITARKTRGFNGNVNPPSGGSYTTTYKTAENRGYDSAGSMTRTVSTSLQVPMPTVKPLSEVLSWRHTVNTIAVMSQIALTGKTNEALSSYLKNDPVSLYNEFGRSTSESLRKQRGLKTRKFLPVPSGF